MGDGFHALFVFGSSLRINRDEAVACLPFLVGILSASLGEEFLVIVGSLLQVLEVIERRCAKEITSGRLGKKLRTCGECPQAEHVVLVAGRGDGKFAIG